MKNKGICFLTGMAVIFTLAGDFFSTAYSQNSKRLLARALSAYDKKNFREASYYLEKYFPFSDPIQDYVLFWWGNSCKELGRYKDAEALYKKIPDTSPVRKAAAEGLTFICEKRERWAECISFIQEQIRLEKDNKLLAPLHAQAVKFGCLGGSPSLAVDNFKILLKDFPGTREASDILRDYGESYSFKDDGICRAGVWLAHGEYKTALEYIEKALSAAQSGTDYRDMLRLKAEALCGLKDYAGAISVLERLINEKSEKGFKLRLGELYLINSPEKGLYILEELSDEKDATETGCRALWKIINYWKEKKDDSRIKLYSRLMEKKYRQFSLADKTLWMEGWDNFVGGDYEEAEKVWRGFDNIPRRSREKLSAMYLRQWMKKDSDKESKELLNKIAAAFPDTYYGLEASRKVSFKPSFSQSFADFGSLPAKSDYNRAGLLFSLSRFNEAVLELEALKETRYNDLNLRYNLCVFYGKASEFCKALHEAESLVDFFEESGRWPGFIHLRDKRLEKINFPRFYCEEVKKRAEEFKLDENLIYALIREETRFDEKDVSCSGAIGLMQIMPSTGKWILEKTGRAYSNSNDFFDPGLNIFMGSWYLRYLLDKFDGDLLLAVAAYNGGPGLIERWVKAGGAEERDIAIEMMPKEETKYYCQKILFSYHIYKELYPVTSPTAGFRKEGGSEKRNND